MTSPSGNGSLDWADSNNIVEGEQIHTFTSDTPGNVSQDILDEDFDPSPSGWSTTDSSNLQITNNEIQVDYHSSTNDSIAYDLGSAVGD